jgi:hypothetical protein
MHIILWIYSPLPVVRRVTKITQLPFLRALHAAAAGAPLGTR